MSSAIALREIRQLKDEACELLAVRLRERDAPAMPKYEGKPALYAKEVLGIDCWDKLAEVMESIHQPPYRTLVKSGHKVGKTNAAGILINYWFDVFDPGVVITTGASWDAMCDTVWSEVRMQRSRAGLPDYFIGPVAPEMRTSPEHWAKLFSVNKPESFQGKHRGRILFLFDEAVGIDRPMFTVASSMFKAEPGYGWICFYNPTDPSSQVYAEEQALRAGGTPKWRTFTLSSLDHPNIVVQRQARANGVELISNQLPMPNAVSISQIDDWVRDWCIQIDPASAEATDFSWKFADGTTSWWRPQMDWEARCTGNWPTQATSSVWSDYLFNVVSTRAAGVVPTHLLPEIGCDVARFGDDKTVIHSRWGNLSLAHGARQGLRTTETTGWLIETATELARLVNDTRRAERLGRPVVLPQEIPIKVDDDGVGGGVTDQLYEQGFNVKPIRAGSEANEPGRYRNKRSELWFATVRRAMAGGVAFSSMGDDDVLRSRLDTDAVQRLKLQAMAPKWKMDPKGRRVVEDKAVTKSKLGWSPDDMDALNLAYYEVGWEAPQSVEIPLYDQPHAGPATEAYRDEGPKAERRRAMFGR